MSDELKPKFCKDFDCKNCYRYLQCWCCKKADLKNNRTCGRKLKMKIGAKAYNEQKIDCFECNINEVSSEDADSSEAGAKSQS